MTKKDIRQAAADIDKQLARQIAAFAISLRNAALDDLLDEAKQIRANFKTGTALGMLESMERRIKAKKL